MKISFKDILPLILTSILILTWSFALIFYNLGYVFLGYFNGIVSAFSIYYLSWFYINNKKFAFDNNEVNK